MEGHLDKLDITSDVQVTGYLNNDELCAIYNEAEVFVFPSHYEGFGFPIVESFCCGTPVVTSDVSSCPEVAEDAALLADPYNPEDIALKIANILLDPQLKQTLRERGFKRAGDFHFHKTAQKTLDVYREVYQSSS